MSAVKTADWPASIDEEIEAAVAAAPAALKDDIVRIAIERHYHGSTCDTCYFVGSKGGPRKDCLFMRRLLSDLNEVVCEITCRSTATEKQS